MKFQLLSVALSIVLFALSNSAEYENLAIRPLICEGPAVTVPGSENVTARAQSNGWTLGPGGHSFMQVALVGEGFDSSNNFAVLLANPDGSLELAMKKGDPILNKDDTVPSGTFQFSFEPVMDAGGNFALPVLVGSEPENFDAILTGNNDSLTTIAEVGEDASDVLAGATIVGLDGPLMNSAGLLAFVANARNEGDSEGVIYTSTGTGKTVTVRPGQHYDGMPPLIGGVESTFKGVFLGSTMFMNESGDLIFTANIDGRIEGITTSNPQGIWRFSNGTITEIALSGREAGIGDLQIGSPRVQSFAGNYSAFNSRLWGAESTPSNDDAVWVANGTSLSLVAREGDLAPVSGGAEAADFTSIFNIAVAENGIAVLQARLSNNKWGLWRWDGEKLSHLASEDGDVPGVPENKWEDFGGISINPNGKIAFSGRRQGPAGRKNDIWVTNSQGQLERIITDGETTFDLPGGAQLTALNPTIPAVNVSFYIPNGSNGRAIPFNAQNELLVKFRTNCNVIVDLDPPLDLGSVSGLSRLDENNDGTPDSLIDGVMVNLFAADGSGDPTGNAIQSTTSISGAYTFVGLQPGNYVVVATGLVGQTLVSDSDGGELGQILVSISEGEDLSGKSFTYQPASGVITGRVQIDPNGDGDPSDAVGVFPFAEIILYDLDNGRIEIARSISDADTGEFSFTGLADGNYAISSNLDFDEEDADERSEAGFYFSFGETLIQIPSSKAASVILLVAKRWYVSGIVINTDDPPAGLSGAIVRVLNASDETPLTDNRNEPQKTGDSGRFEFRLKPGDYVLEENDPPGYISVFDSVLPDRDNRIPFTVSSIEGARFLEFVDNQAQYSITLYSVEANAVQNLDYSGLSNLGPIAPMIPVTDIDKLSEQPIVRKGLVADGVTPLLIKLTANNISEDNELSLECICSVSLSGGTVGSTENGILDHLWHRRGDQWVQGSLENITLTSEQPFEFLYLSALEAEDLHFDSSADLKEITLVLRLIPADGSNEILVEKEIAIRRTPVILGDIGDAWGQDLITELTTNRPREFIRHSDVFGQFRDQWAITRTDRVVHGFGGLLDRGSLETGNFRRDTVLEKHRGKYRRVVLIGTPNNGSRLAPYLEEINSRLQSINQGGAANGVIQFLPAVTRRARSWESMLKVKHDDSDFFPPANLDPRSKYFLKERSFDPELPVSHIISVIDDDASKAFESVGLTQLRLLTVLPDGSDGVVNRDSMLAAVDPEANFQHSKDLVAHEPPHGFFGGIATQKTSASIGKLIVNVLDAPSGSRLLAPYKDPKPISRFEIRDIVEAARDAVADNVVDILPVFNAKKVAYSDTPGAKIAEGGGGLEFKFELDPLESQPITGEVFWFIELYGIGGVTLEGVSVTPVPGNPAAAMVSVDYLAVGDTVLFASYETTDNKIGFANPVLVASQQPLGAVLERIEVLPDKITLPLGETIRPDVVAVYDDGTRITKWVTPDDIGSVISSDTGVVTVDDLPNWEAVGAGTATITTTAFGMTTQSQVTVETPAPARSFDDWKAGIFTTQELGDPNISGDSVDLDGDSLHLFLEYITGGHPWEKNPDLLPQLTTIQVGGESRDVISMRVSTLTLGETVFAQHSGDLQVWEDILSFADDPNLADARLVDYIDGESYLEMFFDAEAGVPAFFRLAVNPGSE